MHRKRAGEPARIESLENLLPSGDDSLPDPASLTPTAIDNTLRHELEEVLHTAISDLPMHFRLPLVLKDIADFKISQIAEILGIKEATVKTRIHRARLTLRKELSDALPQRRDRDEDHKRQICLDLLYAKQESMDQGFEFPMAEDEFCSRCHAVFATLDLLSDTCQCLKSGEIPPEVRESLRREFERPGA